MRSTHFAFLLMAGTALAQGPAPVPPGALPDPIIARIEGEPVRMSDVLATAADVMPPEMRNVPPEALLGMIPPEALRQLIDRTITDRALVAAARARGLDRDPEVRARLARAEAQELTQTLLQREVLPRVTDETIRARYERDQGNAQAEEEVRARHILVPTEAEARTALADLNRGQSFEEVARRMATGPGTREGGDLGWFKRGDMVPPFAEAAFALQPGQLSPAPVRTQFGWHVIRVDERRRTQGPSFDDAREQVRQALLQEEVGAAVERLRNSVRVERVDMPVAPTAPLVGTPPAPPAAAPGRR
jgi:peptidyl-prolyl cis-trans isomerase C